MSDAAVDLMAHWGENPRYITLAQYEEMPDTEHIEVYEGIVRNMASPNDVHQSIVTEILTMIRSHIKGKGGECRVYAAPFDVKLQDKPLTIVQPDVFVLCDKNKRDGRRCNGAPDFCIEIVSPSSTFRDHVTKTLLYQQNGVREYWVVDPVREIVMVYDFLEDQESKENEETEAGTEEQEKLVRRIKEEEIPCNLKIYSLKDKVPVGIFGDLVIDFAEVMEYANG